jgi:hypothetical protein
LICAGRKSNGNRLRGRQAKDELPRKEITARGLLVGEVAPGTVNGETQSAPRFDRSGEPQADRLATAHSGSDEKKPERNVKYRGAAGGA